MAARFYSKSRGFTLVELLLVVALIAISVGVTGDILLSLIRSYNKTQITHEIEQQANYFGLKVEKELRNAVAVAELNGGLGIRITLRNADVIDYNLVDRAGDGVVTRTEGVNTVDVTSNIPSNNNLGGVSVTCPGGSCFTVSGTTPATVRFSFSFIQAGGSGDTSFAGTMDITNTVVIRNTY